MKPGWIQKLLGFTHEALLAVLLIILLLVAKQVHPSFVTARMQAGLYSQIWDAALLAIPMTFIIITGGIDLSVGAIMSLASVMLGIALVDWHWSMWAAAILAVGVGLLCGMLNGFFITKVKVHPLIVTLATLSAFRGLAEGISLPNTYEIPDQYYTIAKSAVHWRLFHLPEFYAVGDRTIPLYGLQIAGWIFVIAAVVSMVILAKTPFGRTLYAIGYNETAARLSGLRVQLVKLAIYSLSGIMAGVVAINVSAGQSTAKADVGSGMELDVITAVVLGGTSIFGGRGRILGTILGVLLIHETRQFVKIHYHKDEWVSVVLGFLLIIAVAANALLGRNSSKK